MNARDTMKIAAIVLAGSLVAGFAGPCVLAHPHPEEDEGVMSGADVAQDEIGGVANDMPAGDALMTEEAPVSSDNSVGFSTEDTDDGDEPAPDAAIEDDLTHEADHLTEQLAEQTALLETAHTGEDRVRIANRIRLLEQELHSLRRVLQ